MIFSRNVKAQAAMEFLMTYGWAILVVLVVISALAYFGVLSPSNLLPEKCTFPVSLNCVDHDVDEDDVFVVLLNGAGRDMLVRNVVASSEALGDGTGGEGCTLIPPEQNKLLRNGQRYNFRLHSEEDFPDLDACDFRNTGRNRNRYNITVFYSWLDSQSIMHTLSGELLARKQ